MVKTKNDNPTKYESKRPISKDVKPSKPEKQATETIKQYNRNVDDQNYKARDHKCTTTVGNFNIPHDSFKSLPFVKMIPPSDDDLIHVLLA